MTASFPVPRLSIHVRRLVAAGHKVQAGARGKGTAAWAQLQMQQQRARVHALRQHAAASQQHGLQQQRQRCT